MDIMDHRAFATTEGYCRIRQERRRQAVDLEHRWQWDAEGNELERIIEAFAESDDIRTAIGSTAIPYGSCVEPSNVAALGSACPYRIRCIGCKHFRTDLTHLGALEEYLTDLLAARERILAASDELADWARRDAMPSDEHIGRVRHLIGRMREKIDGLPSEQAGEVRRILGSQANDRRELGDLAPAAFQLSVIAIDPTRDRQQRMPDQLLEHHRLVSQQKRAAVLRAAEVMIDQGVAFHWTTLARRARVSVKFINDPKHADLKEHVKERLAAAYDQQSAQAVAASNATAAQLRVKVANHAAQLRRQDHVIKMLERKLGDYLGHEIAADLPAITGAALASKPDGERIAELERRVVELEDELLEREETIDGLRTALRQGIRQGEFE